MIADILTVMWKEKKGLLSQEGRSGSVLGMLVWVVVMGIFLPWQNGREWVDSPVSLFISVMIAMTLVAMVIPDSFAGERERHTLGTLLASRLPNRAILFGKVAVAVGYAWGVTLIANVVSLVTLNLVHWEGQVMLYSPTLALANVALSLLMANLAAGAGVLISLRSATVKGAQQTLMAALVIVPAVLLTIALLVLKTVVEKQPDAKARLGEILGALDFTQVILIVIAVLVVVNVGLLFAAMARFQRARLILD